MLIGWHSKQKAGVGDGDLIAFRGRNQALTERLESVSERVQERVQVQKSLDFRFIEHQDVHVTFLAVSGLCLRQATWVLSNSARLTSVYPQRGNRNKLTLKQTW